jgi:hypothetical protein
MTAIPDRPSSGRTLAIVALLLALGAAVLDIGHIAIQMFCTMVLLPAGKIEPQAWGKMGAILILAGALARVGEVAAIIMAVTALVRAARAQTAAGRGAAMAALVIVLAVLVLGPFAWLFSNLLGSLR